MDRNDWGVEKLGCLKIFGVVEKRSSKTIFVILLEKNDFIPCEKIPIFYTKPVFINRCLYVQDIKLFEQKSVRSHYDPEQEKWFFSIIDVIAVLTESLDPSAYWSKLKQRLKAEGNETVTNCHGLKMKSAGGKNIR